MARKFKELVDKMPREAQKRAEAKTEEMIRNMALDELRSALEMTQMQLAEALGIQQAAVSRFERRTDLYVSTLRKFVEAMGGKLEVRAIFPDHGTVIISNFHQVKHVDDDKVQATPVKRARPKAAAGR